jgi:hypothetical protein
VLLPLTMGGPVLPLWVALCFPCFPPCFPLLWFRTQIARPVKTKGGPGFLPRVAPASRLPSRVAPASHTGRRSQQGVAPGRTGRAPGRRSERTRGGPRSVKQGVAPGRSLAVGPHANCQASQNKGWPRLHTQVAGPNKGWPQVDNKGWPQVGTNNGWPQGGQQGVAPGRSPFSEIANRTRLRRRCATNLVNPPASGVLAGHCRIEMRRSQAPANDDGGTGMESASVPNQLERPDKQRVAPCLGLLWVHTQIARPVKTKGGPGFTFTAHTGRRSQQGVAPGRPNKGWPRASSLNNGWPCASPASPRASHCCGSAPKLPGQSKQRVAPASQGVAPGRHTQVAGPNKGWPQVDNKGWPQVGTNKGWPQVAPTRGGPRSQSQGVAPGRTRGGPRSHSRQVAGRRAASCRSQVGPSQVPSAGARSSRAVLGGLRRRDCDPQRICPALMVPEGAKLCR